ncbi:hypothetical protein llg_08110 [Luteolibacter sp. LG18]|nr:hypothetical protein llg_08110 [Luteolibacter sp. LG18]
MEQVERLAFQPGRVASDQYQLAREATQRHREREGHADLSRADDREFHAARSNKVGSVGEGSKLADLEP